MTIVRVLIVTLVFFSGAALAMNAAENHDVLEYQGIARDLENPERVLYTEYHRLQLNNGKPVSREVEYRAPDGRLLASKSNRYGDNPATPEFVLQDARKAYRESARFEKNALVLSLEAQNQRAEKTFRDVPDNLIIDAGFDDFVRKHWDRLSNGKRVKFHFASAVRQDLIEFRLEPQRSNEQEVVLSMRLSSRLLAWLLDPIELTYDRNTQRLLRYRGLTNIQDDSGTTFKADIEYRYSENRHTDLL